MRRPKRLIHVLSEAARPRGAASDGIGRGSTAPQADRSCRICPRTGNGRVRCARRSRVGCTIPARVELERRRAQRKFILALCGGLGVGFWLVGLGTATDDSFHREQRIESTPAPHRDCSVTLASSGRHLRSLPSRLLRTRGDCFWGDTRRGVSFTRGAHPAVVLASVARGQLVGRLSLEIAQRGHARPSRACIR